MGLGGISIWSLLIILLIVALIFGTKRLKDIGGDLGGAVKGFKKALNDDEAKGANKADEANSQEATKEAVSEESK